MSGSSGLYGHFIRTPSDCQALSFGAEHGNFIQGASSFSSERGTLPTTSAETARVCLLSQPFLTRTVRRFTCLPRSSLLVTVGVASWRRRAVRRWYAGRRRCGVGNHSPRQPYRPARQASPEPRARTQVSQLSETGTGARASCSLEGLRWPASRSRTGEPGACGRPQMVAHQINGARLFAGGTGDTVGRLGSGEATAVTRCTRFGSGALAGWREHADRIGCDGTV
jgi:hypothetical protein